MRSAVGKLLPSGETLREVATAITSPLLPDDYLSLLNPLWSARELRGRVDKVVTETGDAVTLVIRPGWGWTPHEPGQYVGVGVLVEGRWVWRSYSLTSSPEPGHQHISVTVKEVEDGYLSGRLIRDVAPGTVVRLAQPAGEFVLPDPPPERLLFLTAGSGITPVMGMLRSLDERGMPPDVVVVHSAPTPEDAIFRDELRALAERHEGLRLVERNTRADGRITAADLGDVCPDWSQRPTWACGPASMLEDVQGWYADEDAADLLQIERFESGIGAAGAGDGGEVTFTTSGRTVSADGATPLLEVGEGAGVRLPFGCRMGICHTCVVPLAAGRVRDLRTGKEFEGAGTPIQTCVCAVAGECSLDL